jgi:hypothetical protein
MVFGITMVKVKPAQDSIVYESIRSIKGIKEIYKIFGEYSFFLIMEAYSYSDLGRITGEIGEIGDVIEMPPVMFTEDGNILISSFSESKESAIV